MKRRTHVSRPPPCYGTTRSASPSGQAEARAERGRAGPLSGEGQISVQARSQKRALTPPHGNTSPESEKKNQGRGNTKRDMRAIRNPRGPVRSRREQGSEAETRAARQEPERGRRDAETNGRHEGPGGGRKREETERNERGDGPWSAGELARAGGRSEKRRGGRGERNPQGPPEPRQQAPKPTPRWGHRRTPGRSPARPPALLSAGKGVPHF